MTPAPETTRTPDPVADLHGVVRKWTEHIPQNLPYIDLMFAFGYATLGDRARALALVEDARKVMVVPIPTDWHDNRHFEATISAVTRNFLFKAFRYRIEQALARKPHTGPLSDELLADLSEIESRSHAGGTNNPYLRAAHVIDRVRHAHTLLEPSVRVDPYSSWTKNQDALKRALSDLSAIREPAELIDRIRTLYRDGSPGKDIGEVRFLVLHEALPLAPRAGEAFTVELLQLVPEVLAAYPHGTPEPPDLPRKQGELLERALFLAGNYDRGDLVKTLVDVFVSLVRSKPETTRFKLINVVAGQCLWSLKKLGMRDELDRLLATLRDDVLGGATVAELRAKHAADPEMWAAVLQTLLNLAGGWLTFGMHEPAAPILDAARHELLDPTAVRIPPKEYTALAQTYVAALGQGPSEPGFARITELFRDMDRRKITNTWTTALYFSRFHLALAEDVVRAIGPTGLERPYVVSG